jgi:recombination protein RecR
MRFPKSIQNLIDQFSKLPTVGPKTAERYVFYLLKRDPEELKLLAQAVNDLQANTTLCRTCFTISESDPCQICSDQKRNTAQLCIVADSRDLAAIEGTGQFKGLYHVLNGELDAIAGIKPEQLTIKELQKKIAGNSITEIILALDPTIEGETTSLYLAKLIRSIEKDKIRITRLAKGLPMGADIEYADEMTISNALKYRNEL